MVKYTIRKFNWDRINKEGLPLDGLEVMEFFNRGLKTEYYKWVNRKSEITIDEIKNRWALTKDIDVVYVAVDPITNKIVSDGMLIVNSKENKAELIITNDINHIGKGIGTELVKILLKEAKERRLMVTLHTSISNNLMIDIMKTLGYEPSKIEESYVPDRFKNSDVAVVPEKVYYYSISL
ncbi:MAG: hypothetical protein PHD81_01595 [Candidatus Nanoarchaeia archaeon]|nr:hypothetical protein [Candidatus Nanoarchaeia archaeon]MDD5587782.1 hypothetical protein [Candidatus Nanoarchaeia archaeon]